MAPGLPVRAGGSRPWGRPGEAAASRQRPLLPRAFRPARPAGFSVAGVDPTEGLAGLGRDLLPVGAGGLEPAAVPSLRPGHGVGLGKCLLNKCPEGADAGVRPLTARSTALPGPHGPASGAGPAPPPKASVSGVLLRLQPTQVMQQGPPPSLAFPCWAGPGPSWQVRPSCQGRRGVGRSHFSFPLTWERS